MNENIIQKIALNFLPIEQQKFSFKVFRRLANPQEKKWSDDIRIYKLPNEQGEYKPYWVSFQQFDNSALYTVEQSTNNELTKWYLYYLLLNKVKDINTLKIIPEKNKFIPLRIWFEIENFPEGKRTIWMEPYYLKSKDKFGFLIGFKFLKEKNKPFNKKVQILSFSLNKDGRSNANYHIDIYYYIKNFINKHLKNFRELSSDTITISISNRLETISNELLKTKTYIFANYKTDNSQFNGVMKYGVFEKVNYESIKYIYLFEEKHKDLANDLLKALNGETFETFKGIEKLNLPKQDKSNMIALRYNNTDEAIDKINKEINTNNEKVIVISILPAKDEEFYYRIKKACLDRNIPLQVVHVETIQDTNKLKWSAAGIALQIFVKLGGTPWLVEPSNQNCLIVGLGQSIHKDKNGNIKKFRTYSVLLDSSGKFLTIEPLSEEYNLEQIGDAIKSIISKNNNYNKIAFHIPQKINKEIIEKIKNILIKENQNIEFTIIRINDDSKFFGFNTSENSRVPFESTFVQLGSKEYLLWPEGLNYHNKRVSKKYGNPLYVEFYYSNNENIDHKSYLQDILNLSGANYRGFNAKFLPVSIYYPKLISGFNKNFDRFNIEQVTKENNMLWFI